MKCLSERSEEYIFLSGNAGTGLSHLLQAACKLERDSIYLNLGLLDGNSTDKIFDGLEQMSLVCLDDIHIILSNQCRQKAIFHFFNRCSENGTRLVLASHKRLNSINIRFPDLVTRLKSGVVLHFEDYRDDDLLNLIKYRATLMGLNFTHDWAVYIFNRTKRTAGGVVDALRKIDLKALTEKRPITLPLIKSALDL
jgi:DnaA family protein